VSVMTYPRIETATAQLKPEELTVEIGGVPIRLRVKSRVFAQLIRQRYSGFVTQGFYPEATNIVFDVNLREAHKPGHDLPENDADLEEDDDLEVTRRGEVWQLRRGDFAAEWNVITGSGKISQAANPYSLDSVLRIVHSLVLAQNGDFLLHGASTLRNGRAFLFAGVSGAGKTTISRLAPRDATLLTDEISYVRWTPAGYEAHGTPFAGELAQVGEHCSAPIEVLYLLRQGPENRIDDVPRTVAVQSVLRNVLFFAHDTELVRRLFEGACRLVDTVPVRRLTFLPTAAVWDLIR
jgi:hypothetical protein